MRNLQRNKMTETITKAEAAKSLGVGVKTIENYIKDGKLTAYKPAQKVLVTVESIENFKLSKKL